jgi:hypothetical protein
MHLLVFYKDMYENARSSHQEGSGVLDFWFQMDSFFR